MSRFLAACRGEEVDRPPVWIMRQAGRYLPEYRRLRQQAGSFVALCTNPHLAAEATLQPLRRFPLDAAIIFSDILLPLQALGVEVAFSENGGPRLPAPLATPQQWARLAPSNSWDSLSFVGQALAQVRRHLPPEVALIGFCGAPWTLACYLLEGRGSSDWAQARRAAYQAPEELGRLLQTLGQAMGDYLVWQVRAGAQAVQVFDSWAGVLPADLYQALVVPALQRLLEQLEGLGVPRILYLGQGQHLLGAVRHLPLEVVSVDWRTPLAYAAQATGKGVQGNLDPAVLFAPPEEVIHRTRQMLRSAPPRGYIANLGHGIWPETPVEGVEAFLHAVRESP
ncbi:MAG: uroporphyrinogen decarboxylase [Thermoanaerobaculum sp.]|nr:uroporphyrinogen decarboxylase [Thermoanaerobaculum sp.]